VTEPAGSPLPPVRAAGREQRVSYQYRAFISYKHVVSSAFAATLEQALKTYAKPLFAPPLRIFRDEKHLAPGGDLPELIARALNASEFLILLASPEAASSPWVHDELDRWCRILGRTDHLIVVLTRGNIAVDETSKEVNWEATDALPAMLREHLTRIPLYVDMRGLVSDVHLTLQNPAFKRAVNGISARLRNRDPNDMLGEEIAQHKKTLLIGRSAVGLLIGLSAAAAVAANSAHRQALIAGRERNSALERESELLAAESVRLRNEGRFAEAITAALRATPDSSGPDGRPDVPAAQAALEAAVVTTPLRFHAARSPGDLAGVWIDTSGNRMLTLGYDGAATLHSTDPQKTATRFSLTGATTCATVVACRNIFGEMVRCIFRNHGMTGGCLNPEPLPGYTRGDLLHRCETLPGNSDTRRFLATANLRKPDAVLETLASARVDDVTVAVRVDTGTLRLRVAPRFSTQRIAAYLPDRRRIVVLAMSGDHAIEIVSARDRAPLALRWINDDDLAVVDSNGVDRIRVSSGRVTSTLLPVRLAFERPMPRRDGDWLGVSARGRSIVRLDGSDSVVERGGTVPNDAVFGEQFSDLSGVYWLRPAKRTPQLRSQVVIGGAARVTVLLHDSGNDRAVPIDGVFRSIVAVLSLDSSLVAIVESDRASIADRRTGRVTGSAIFPTSTVRSTAVLSVTPFYRTTFHELFGEQAQTEAELILVTEDGVALVYGTSTHRLRQLDLHGATVKRLISTPLDVILLAETNLLERGRFTYAFVVPRESDASPLMMRSPLEVGAFFDFAAADERGRFLALSENGREVSLYKLARSNAATFCAVRGDGGDGFFHIRPISPRRAIAVADRGLCLIDGATSRFVPTRFPIAEFLYAGSTGLVVVGHSMTGLFTGFVNDSAFRQLPRSRGEINSIALSADDATAFAVVDSDLYAWSVDEGTLEYASDSAVGVPASRQSRVHLDSLSARLRGRVGTMVVSPKAPMLAIGTWKDGEPNAVILASFDGRMAREFAAQWTTHGLRFTPDGRQLLLLDSATLRSVNVTSGLVTIVGKRDGIQDLKQLIIDPSGKHVLGVPDRDIVQPKANAVRLWHLEDTTVKELVLPLGIRNAAFDNEGRLVLVQDDSGHTALFRAADGVKLRETPQHDFEADFGGFASGDHLVVSGSSIDGKIRVIDAASGSQLLEYEQEWGSSVNNAFGSLEPIVAMPELNAFFVATRSAVVALPFYFDHTRLRAAAERLARAGQ
jgi:hypothetical protein